ncbi:glycosyltransferase family 2 protein [Candidatus Woesebacteria bacterium]|nr:glycosyltransferase family 2 protein [Candidatus Woesebacteria bacterium]
MKFSVAICSKNREKSLERTVRSILNQSLLPSTIFIVKTVKVVTKNFHKKIIIIKDSAIEIYLIEISENKAKTIGFSRNIALSLCKTKELFFVDDDVILKFNTFKKLMKVLKNDNRLFSASGRVVGIDSSLFSRYMTFFHSQGFLNPSVPQLMDNASTTCVLIDMDKWRKNKIFFPTEISAGEDVLFFAYFREQKYSLMYCPKITIKHDFFPNRFDFFRRFFWYSSSMIETNKIDNRFFYEYFDYLPLRRLHLIFFPFFLIFRAFSLTKVSYNSEKIRDKSLFWAEYLRNMTYVVGVTYSKFFKKSFI